MKGNSVVLKKHSFKRKDGGGLTFQSYSEMFLKQLNHGEAVGLLFQLVHLVYGKSLEEVHRVALIS